MDIANRVTSGIIGASGFGASELVNNAVIPNLTVVNDVTTILVQIAILIATLAGIFRKKK